MLEQRTVAAKCGRPPPTQTTTKSFKIAASLAECPEIGRGRLRGPTVFNRCARGRVWDTPRSELQLYGLATRGKDAFAPDCSPLRVARSPNEKLFVASQTSEIAAD